MAKESAKAANQLETVTDFHEDAALDAQKSTSALEALSVAQAQEQQDEDLDMSITISPEDLTTIMDQLEVDKEEAEKALRRNGGSVVAALRAIIAAPP